MLDGQEARDSPRLWLQSSAMSGWARESSQSTTSRARRSSTRDPGPTGCDVVVFSVRPNPWLAFGAVADTASGGELSRIALAMAAVAGGETIVFDEIDAGIGGVTAHAVADVLRRLATRAQDSPR